MNYHKVAFEPHVQKCLIQKILSATLFLLIFSFQIKSFSLDRTNTDDITEKDRIHQIYKDVHQYFLPFRHGLMESHKVTIEKAKDKILTALLISASAKGWNQVSFQNYIFPIFEFLLQNDLIQVLTSESKKVLCTSPHETRNLCLQMRGFYIPILNEIWLDESLLTLAEQDDQSLNRLSSVLYHEVLHAYQYIIRLPLDLNALEKSFGKSTDAQVILQSLSLLYEAQAHYQSLQLFPHPSWEKVHRKSMFNKASSVGKAVVALVSNIGSSTVNLAGDFAQTVTGSHKTLSLANSIEIGAKELNKLLPLPDKIQDTKSGKLEPIKRSAFVLSEPVLNQEYGMFYNGATSLDFRWHQTFFSSLISQYFGSLNFITENLKNSQSKFVIVHDSYYGFLSRSNNQYEACLEDLLRNLKKYQSPLLMWSQIRYAEGSNCKGLQILPSEELQSSIKKILIIPLKESTPFSIIKPGTEGGRLDQGLHPLHLHIQPQIELEPAMKSMHKAENKK